MANFVLVHGSWHGGWCWQKLKPFLADAGHKVYTPTLTGLGERSDLADKETGLHTHIDEIVQLLEKNDLKDVILVGHSYGGLVISGVAEKVPGRIRRLVYMDAFVPEDGDSMFDFIEDKKEVLEKVKEEGDGWLIRPYPPERMGVKDPKDIAWMKPLLKPMPLQTYKQSVKISNPKARNLRKSYIICSKTSSLEPTIRKVKAEGWDIHELYVGHDAMIIAPKELANILIKLS